MCTAQTYCSISWLCLQSLVLHRAPLGRCCWPLEYFSFSSCFSFLLPLFTVKLIMATARAPVCLESSTEKTAIISVRRLLRAYTQPRCLLFKFWTPAECRLIVPNLLEISRRQQQPRVETGVLSCGLFGRGLNPLSGGASTW